MKNLLFLSLFLICFSNVSAQGLDFGVKAGVNFARISDASGLSNRTGFTGGIFAGGTFADKFGIQGELLYSQQGAEFEFGDFNLDYVNVPILVRYFLVQGLNVQAGPQFGILVNDDAQALVGEVINDIATNKFDISGVIGLGYDLPLGLRVSGRYHFGLNDVADNTRGKNSVVTLAVGYSFF